MHELLFSARVLQMCGVAVLAGLPLDMLERMTLAGLEPAISGSEDQRLIH